MVASLWFMVVLVSVEVVGWVMPPCKAMVSCMSSSAVSCGNSNCSHNSASESEPPSVVVLPASERERDSEDSVLMLSASVPLSARTGCQNCHEISQPYYSMLT